MVCKSTTPLVSIVIPVYNVEKYLRQCLNSVVNQTLRNIQIICINDGSTDSSLAILQEYAAKDSRIEIVDKPNGGLSSARNAAYPYLQGKYTLFVDSDDWIELDLCEKTCYTAENCDAVMTIFFFQQWKEKKIQRFPLNDKVTTAEKIPILDFPSACSKLWRANFLLENKLYFPEGLVFEDNLVNWQAVTRADRIAVVSERLYHHRYNNTSITHTWNERALDLIPIYNKIREYLLASGYYDEYRNKFISMKLDVWYRHYRNLPVALQTRCIEMIRDSLSADDREFYRSATKVQCKPVVKLFYSMIDGDKNAALKFQVAHTMKQIARMPELFINRWIVKPIKQRREAA